MIYWCSSCGKFIYPHELEQENICPYCNWHGLDLTDEDEQ